MFFTQTYYQSTAGRVKLELGNNERPTKHEHFFIEILTSFVFRKKKLSDRFLPKLIAALTIERYFYN